MMVFLAVLQIFSSKTLKFRQSVTKKRQLLGDFVPHTPYRGPGLCPWTLLGDFCPPDRLGPLLSHILNTPLLVNKLASCNHCIRFRVLKQTAFDCSRGLIILCYSIFYAACFCVDEPMRTCLCMSRKQ